jgi:DNA-binding transcriptional regulator YiaG
MQQLKRIRCFLELRQVDLERATGIPVRKLSEAESGSSVLSHAEEQLLKEFLAARMRVVVATEGEAVSLTN